jgi:Restriction endonuclease
MILPPPINDVVAYFLTEYPIDSPAARLEDVVTGLLRKTFNAEATDALMASHLGTIREALVKQFNARYGSRNSLRYRLIDDEGNQIAGIGGDGKSRKLAFQDALNALSHSQFEGVAALILTVAGCDVVYRTPESHDQGLDAFGYQAFLRKTRNVWAAAPPQLIFLAQAKHYKECRVGTKEIREFVGSYDLAVHKIYSTVDERYQQLDIPPFAPVALLFLTTEEIADTVKRLATRSGIVVLTSDDLFEIVLSAVRPKPKSVTRAWLRRHIDSAIRDIPVAR